VVGAAAVGDASLIPGVPAAGAWAVVVILSCLAVTGFIAAIAYAQLEAKRKRKRDDIAELNRLADLEARRNEDAVRAFVESPMRRPGPAGLNLDAIAAATAAAKAAAAELVVVGDAFAARAAAAEARVRTARHIARHEEKLAASASLERPGRPIDDYDDVDEVQTPRTLTREEWRRNLWNGRSLRSESPGRSILPRFTERAAPSPTRSRPPQF